MIQRRWTHVDTNNNGNRNILSVILIDLKILQNGLAHRFQRTRISKEQVLWFDLGFAIR